MVAAPEFAPGVMDIFAKWKNLRVMRIANMARLESFVGAQYVDFKSLVDGGIVVQTAFVPTTLTIADFLPAAAQHKGRDYRVARAPTPTEQEDLLFGWLVETGITSNSVIYVKDGATVGIGTGEQDRVGVAEIARDKAYRKLADRLSWESFAAPYASLAKPEARAEIDREVARPEGRHRRLVHGLRRLLPVPRRGGRGAARGGHGHRAARRVGPGLRVHRGVQRGGRGHGLHGPALLQALGRQEGSQMYERNVSHIEALVKQQNEWRGACINLIASENVTSRRIRGVMGSDFAHRYAEGHPGERYYQGTEIIDEIESLLKQHMKGLFRCRHSDVRPISGTIANDAVFSRYIRPGDVVMVNSTPGGGHISHHKAGSVGKYTKNIVNFPLTADG